MKKNVLVLTLCLTAATLFANSASDLLKKYPESISFKDKNGIYYLKSEMNYISKGKLTEKTFLSSAKAAKNKNPLPAITRFNSELKKRGIKLIIVPVPPKSSVYPPTGYSAEEFAKSTNNFIKELNSKGIETVNLIPFFQKNANKQVFCKTDSHWSPSGIEIAAEILADKIKIHEKEKITSLPQYSKQISGDLPAAKHQDKETLVFAPVKENIFDENSPVLLLGDSHCLIFSDGGDMLEKNAGFPERLAVKAGLKIDRIAVRGSASTAARLSLYRKASSSAEWLKNKKYVIWCFSCREFTESQNGWMIIPVSKK